MGKPTPTPWKLEFYTPVDMGIEDANGKPIEGVKVWLDDACRDGNYLREANAAHIVKCVNLHDELVEASHDFHNWFKEFDSAAYPEINSPQLKRLLAVLEKAK